MTRHLQLTWAVALLTGSTASFPTIAEAADLTVRLTELPSYFGTDLTTSYRLCNEGSAPAGPSRLALFLSTDALLDAADSPIADVFAAPLDPGACEDGQLTGQLFAPTGSYHLLAQADADQTVVESDESNNLFAGPETGSGNGADLVVGSLRAPATLAGFGDLEIEVCNLGPAPVGSFDIEAWASEDETIESPLQNPASTDQYLGQTHVTVGAEACATVIIPAPSAWPSGPGATSGFVGVLVDPAQVVPELVESNNQGLSGRVGFGSGPQGRISSASLAVGTQSPYVVSVRACNEGTQPATGDVTLYASTDEILDLALDTLVGPTPLPGTLEPGRCAKLDIPAHFGPPSPTFFIADLNLSGELVAEDDLAVVGPVQPGTPNLIAEAVQWRRLPTGEVELSAEVCNLSDAPSGSTDLDFLTSLYADVELAANGYYQRDMQVTRVGLATGVEAGACATVSATAPGPLPLPYSAGPVAASEGYLGVRVDPDGLLTEASDADNAVSTPIGLGYGPDLSVTRVERVFSAGQAVALAEVCNLGFAPSGSFDVEWVASADETPLSPTTHPSSPDLWLGSASSSAGLEPGACATLEASIPLQLYLPNADVVFLGALVNDPSGADLDGRNDSGVSAPLAAGAAPNLVVRSVERETVFEQGILQVELSARVCNEGMSFVSSFELDFVTSTDAVVEPYLLPLSQGYFEDFQVQRVVHATPLEPGACATVSTLVPELWVPPSASPDADIHLGARVNPAQTVADPVGADDTAIVGPVPTGYGPNVYVAGGGFEPDGSTGGAAYSVEICNDGLSPAGSVDVELIASDDDLLIPSWSPSPGMDVALGQASIFQLPSLRCVTVSLAGPLPPQLGTDPLVTLGAAVRTSGPDANPSDDVAVLSTELLAAPSYDLAVGGMSTQVILPASPELELRTELCNRGFVPSPTVDLSYFVSADAQLDRNQDLPVGPFASAPSLEPGACTELVTTVPGPLPQVGGVPTQWVFAALEPSQISADPVASNDVSDPTEVGTGYGPDLRFGAVRNLGFDATSQMLEFEAEVCNQGFAPANGFDVDLVLSADEIIETTPWPTQDMMAAQSSIASLDPARCVTVVLSTPPYFPITQPGGPFGGLRIDAAGSVTNEIYPGDQLYMLGQLGSFPAPNLAMRALTARVDTSMGYPEWLIEAEVCNLGSDPSSSFDVALFLSADAQLEPELDGASFEDMPFGGMYGSAPLQPGACQTQSTRMGYLPSPPSVVSGAPLAELVYLAGRVVSTSPDAREDDDVAVSGPVVTGSAFDLRVASVAVSADTTNGFLEKVITVEACNDSLSATTGFDVELAVSEDETFDPYFDYPVGLLSFGPLSPGACTSLSLRAGPLPTPGASSEAFLLAAVQPFGNPLDPNPSNDIFALAGVGTGPNPDLVISTFRVVRRSGQLRAVVRACNEGFSNAASFSADVLMSADATVESPLYPSSDFPVTWLNFPSLAPGACRQRAMDFPSMPLYDDQGQPVSQAWFGAFLDPSDGVVEAAESNNFGLFGPFTLP